MFRDTAADFVSAFTMNYVEEAIGIARAARRAEMPVVISFTVETDGRLPTGQTLKEAIVEVDAETGAAPGLLHDQLRASDALRGRARNRRTLGAALRGLRANASTRSHAELDQATDLDAGDAIELGHQYADLRRSFRHITVLGGCCGTDFRHVEQICFACEPVA